jgi:hypothetical protein
MPPWMVWKLDRRKELYGYIIYNQTYIIEKTSFRPILNTGNQNLGIWKMQKLRSHVSWIPTRTKTIGNIWKFHLDVTWGKRGKLQTQKDKNMRWELILVLLKIFLWNSSFHRNFIGIWNSYSFVPNSTTGMIPIGILSSKILRTGP